MKPADSSRTRMARWALWTALVLLAMLFVSAAAVSAAPSDPVTGPTQPSWTDFLPHEDDALPREFGAEGAGGAQQAYAASEVNYLSNRLQSCGWTQRYRFTGNNAWEEDFKRSALGGTEPGWLDTADLGFYVGHGGPDSFTFDVWHDDRWLTPDDCYQTWGRYDNEWVALTSCSVLSGAHPNPWANCMYGNHLVLGFKTGAAVRSGTGTQGYQFANHLCYGWTVPAAWFRACDLTNPAGAVVTAFAEEAPCFNDRPGVWDCGPESNFTWSTYWYINHVCGSPLPEPLSVPQAVTQMPVFQTEPLTLDEANQLFGDLGTTFGLAPQEHWAEAACNQADPWVTGSADGAQQLEMDCYSGQFSYLDQNMWSSSAAEQAVAAARADQPLALTAQGAKEIADAFLNANGLMPGDAKFSDTGVDVTSNLSKNEAPQVELAETPLVYQVIYGRTVTATVGLAEGLEATEEFQVFGPGGKLIVSVPVAPVAEGKAALPVAGTLGGWPMLQAPAEAVKSVPILTEAQILKLHSPALEGFVVLNNPPVEATEHRVISTTLGYWSEGLSQSQPELIPSYVLSIDYYNNQAVVMHGWEYIPANSTYMRPYAKMKPLPAGVLAGTTIQLEAYDAAQTLAQLGYDAGLNFALGNGPFIYTWYVDSIAPGNQIGVGRTAQYVMTTGDEKNGVLNRQIILQVTDSGSSAQLSSTDSGNLQIWPENLFLPEVHR